MQCDICLMNRDGWGRVQSKTWIDEPDGPGYALIAFRDGTEHQQRCNHIVGEIHYIPDPLQNGCYITYKRYHDGREETCVMSFGGKRDR